MSFFIHTIIIGAVLAYNDRKTTSYKWTGCVSKFTGDCTYDCSNVGSQYESCVYETWDHCGAFNKKCKCKCERNVDLAPCFELDIEAYASNGHYYLTDQIYNGKEVYSRRTTDPRYIYYSSTPTWRIAKSVGESPFAWCSDRPLLKDCDNGVITKKCHSLWRSDGRCGGTHKSDGFNAQTAICNAESNAPCCSNAQWCGATADHCTCDSCMNYQNVHQSCVLEEITQPVDFCEITPLDKVDEEIGKQILWNVAGVLAGNVPVVGDFFDVYFAAMDPVSPVTSAQTLTNNLITAVNTQISSLKNCMDQEISNTEKTLLSTFFDVELGKASHCRKLKGDPKKVCVTNSWLDFRPLVNAVFKKKLTGTKTYLKYENMLPIYQSIYPVFMAVAAGRMKYLKDANDGCNFNTALDAAKTTMGYLYQWGHWALDDIVNQLTPDNNWNTNSCGNDQTSHMDQYYEIWTNKDYLKAKQYFSRGVSCGANRHYKSMDVELKMTKETNKWCQFRLEGDFLCGKTWSQLCTYMKNHAGNFVNNINNRLQNEYRPQFTKRFIQNVEKFKNALNNIPRMTCSSGAYSDEAMKRLQLEEEEEDKFDINAYINHGIYAPKMGPTEGIKPITAISMKNMMLFSIAAVGVVLSVYLLVLMFCLRKQSNSISYECVDQSLDDSDDLENK